MGGGWDVGEDVFVAVEAATDSLGRRQSGGIGWGGHAACGPRASVVRRGHRLGRAVQGAAPAPPSRREDAEPSLGSNASPDPWPGDEGSFGGVE